MLHGGYKEKKTGNQTPFVVAFFSTVNLKRHDEFLVDTGDRQKILNGASRCRGED